MKKASAVSKVVEKAKTKTAKASKPGRTRRDTPAAKKISEMMKNPPVLKIKIPGRKRKRTVRSSSFLYQHSSPGPFYRNTVTTITTATMTPTWIASRKGLTSSPGLPPLR